MEALVNLFAQYFGIDPAVLFAAINAQQASEDNRVVNDNAALDSSDAADDESDEYVNGVYVGDNDSSDHDESSEHVNGVYTGDNDHDESDEYVNGVYVGDNDSSDHDESSEHVNGVYTGDNDHDESDEYVNGVYIGDNDSSDHDESNEYTNGVYDGSAVARSSAGYSEISDDRNDQYRFGLSGSELADGDLVDAGEQIVAKYELGRRGWEFDRLDSDESLAVQVFNNEAFIIETEYERPGKVEFKIFSDLDGDQVWTEVVEGEAYSSSTSIDLVGLVNAGVIDPAMLLG
jgi:sarcosine oxidase delta subunit